MQKANIVWLASYPKSGNTWFRAFLTALLGEEEDIDLNGLKTTGIFSSREIVEAFTDIDSTYLYDEEVKLLLPEIFSSLSNEFDKEQFIKVHDAYTLNNAGKPIIPAGASKCAIYIVRNPLDVVASFANHMGTNLDQAISVMNNPKGSLAPQKGNQNISNQVKQLMLDWSSHVQSWTQQTDIPVHLVRYEDMLEDPLPTFLGAVNFMQINATEENVQKAIEASSFKKLQAKETAVGFRERPTSTQKFFRLGKSGNWRNELTAAQASKIVSMHKNVMQQCGYDTNLQL